MEGSSLGLEAGEVLRVETLLYGLLLHSGNDAAVALAIYCDGSVEAFADRMNRRAWSWGCGIPTLSIPTAWTPRATIPRPWIWRGWRQRPWKTKSSGR